MAFFPFGNIFFLFRDIYVFVLCKWGKWWRRRWFHQLKQYNTQSRIFPEILEQCSSNLAPETYITKEKEWHLLCCYHGNTLGSSLFLWKPNIPICNLLKWDRGSSSVHKWFPYCLKDVRANCFCASLLRTWITCHVMPRHASSARAKY